MGLPFIQRVLYCEGLRPYMDYSTGIIGIKRGISYQSLSETLYIEPHRGYRTGSPSKSQIRRALRGLEKVGLISAMQNPDKLIFKCLLADQDNFDQKKVITKPSPQVVSPDAQKNTRFSGVFEDGTEKAITPKSVKAVTPPVSGNIIIKTHIQTNYNFSKKFFEDAKSEHLLDGDEEQSRLDFIAFHQSRGTLSCNWDAEYLRWLLMRKKYQQEEKNKIEPRKNHLSQRRSGFISAVDRVRQARLERLKNSYGRLIDGGADHS